MNATEAQKVADSTATVSPDLEPKVQEVPDTEDPIEINDQNFIVIGTTMKKGKGKGRLAYYLKPEPDHTAFFARLREAVGPENWDKCVYAEVVRKACNDATLQAINQSEDGKPSDVALAKAIVEWFLPSTRRSGTHIKDLREKAQEIFSELNPLLLRHFEKKPGEPGSLSEDEHNRLLQLTLEYSDINTKIEEKSRKGKTAVAAKK